MKPTDSLTAHFRLTPVQIAALRRLGVLSVEDLLRHFPSRYERAGASARTTELVPGTKVTLFGTLTKLKAKKLWKSRRTATTGTFEDGSGKVNVMWFNQPYIASYVPEGSHVKMTGTVGGTTERPYIANPEVELVLPGTIAEGLFDPETEKGDVTIFPVYPESRGITSLWFFHALKRVFEDGVHIRLNDPIPDTVREKYHLPDSATALHYIHAPEKEAHAEAARKRFAFEEIFVLQVARARDRALNDTLSSFPIANALAQAKKFLDSTDLVPTWAREKRSLLRQQPMRLSQAVHRGAFQAHYRSHTWHRPRSWQGNISNPLSNISKSCPSISHSSPVLGARNFPRKNRATT